MSSGGDKTTGTSKTTANLTKDVTKALSGTLKDAQGLYTANDVYKPYTGSTVIPYSETTKGTWDGIWNQSQNAMPALNQAYNNVGAIATGTGMNATQNGAVGQLQNIANGSNGITTGGAYNNLANSQGTTTAAGYADMAGKDAITTGAGYQALQGTGTNTAGAYGAIAAGNGGINTGGLYSQIGKDANGSYSESNLQNYANGSQIGASNPAFERVLQRTQTDAQDAVQRGASAAGRYGSGIAQGNVAREVGGVTSTALANQYNQDVSNQFSANSLLDSQRAGNLGTRLNAAAGQTGVDAQNMNNKLSALGGQTAAQGQSYSEQLAALAGLSGVQGQNASTRLNALNGQTSAEGQSYSQKLSALAGLTGVQGQNISNQQSAAGDVFNAGQQATQNQLLAAGQLPAQFDATLDPYRAQAGIGAQQEDLATRQKNDELRIFQEQADQKRKSIEWLSSLASGQGALTGGTTTTASKPGQNPFIAGIGGALSGYGSTGTLTGGLLGGATGALGSIF